MLRRANVLPPPFQLKDDSVGMDIRNHYVMHTGMVKVDLSSLHTFEYIRNIKNENVEELVTNILVCGLFSRRLLTSQRHKVFDDCPLIVLHEDFVPPRPYTKVPGKCLIGDGNHRVGKLVLQCSSFINSSRR